MGTSWGWGEALVVKDTLLFQRTWVCYLAPTCLLTTFQATPVPGDPIASPHFHGHLQHNWCAYIYTDKALICKLFFNKPRLSEAVRAMSLADTLDDSPCGCHGEKDSCKVYYQDREFGESILISKWFSIMLSKVYMSLNKRGF